MLFSLLFACSTIPFYQASDKGPTPLEQNQLDTSEETEISSEEDDVSSLNDEDSDPEEALDEQEKYFLLSLDDSCTSPCSFQVSTNYNVDIVRYFAEEWPLEVSSDAENNFEISWDFSLDGTRTIRAEAYNQNNVLLATAEEPIEVLFAQSLPEIPYFYQYSNSLSPGSTCANTSIAMVLSYYGWQGNPDEITTYYGVSQAQSPHGLASVFNSETAYFGLPVTLQATTNASLSELHQELDSGNPVIVHGYFTSSGHVLVVLGYDSQGYWVHDPAGTWNGQFMGGYLLGWEPTAGNEIYYDKTLFELAIQSTNGYNNVPLWMHKVR